MGKKEGEELTRQWAHRPGNRHLRTPLCVQAVSEKLGEGEKRALRISG
jgi:hypothetical protein